MGDDFRYVEPVYCGPDLKTFPDGSIEGYFGERYKYACFEAGRYLEACYLPFAGVNRLEDLDRSHFPSADWFDYSTVRRQAEALRERGFAVCVGTAGDMDFINGIARTRGMEQVLMDLIDDNPVYLEIMQARFEFFWEVQRRTLEAAGGLVDFAHCGEDLGNQRGPMISRYLRTALRPQVRPVLRHGPLLRRADDDAHVRLLRGLSAAVDRVGPGRVRRSAAHHAVDGHRRLAGAIRRAAFFLRYALRADHARLGTPADVEREVRRRLALFPKGGLFLGPTHAVQAGSPLENILTMYRTAGSLTERIDDAILSLGGEEVSAKVNRSKLF